MRAEGDLDATAIMAFTLAVFGVVGAGGILSAVGAVVANGDDVVDITTTVVVAFVIAAVDPLIAGALAWSAKGRIDRARQPIAGYGLATAAQVLVVLALITLVLGALSLLSIRTVEFTGTSASTNPVDEVEPADGDLLSGVLFGDGATIVGDAVPGTYQAVNPTEACTWARLAFLPATGDMPREDYVIAEGAGPNVTIEQGDGGFESDGCGTWKLVID